MKKKFKLLALLLIGGGMIFPVILTVFVDPNIFKEQIASVIRMSIHRDVQFVDDFKLSYFPQMGIKTGKIVIGNPEGFGTLPFATLESAKIGVKLIPLLQKKLSLKGIKIIGFKLALVRQVEGKSNWDDFVAKEEEKDLKAKEETTPVDFSFLKDLHIQKVLLSETEISYSDHLKQQFFSLSAIEFQVDEIKSGTPFTIHFSGIANSKSLNLQSELLLDASSVFDVEQQTLKLSSLTFKAFGLELQSQFLVSNLFSTPTLKGTIATPGFNLSHLLQELQIPLPPFRDPGVLAWVELNTHINLTEKDVRFSGLQIKIDETTLTANAELRDWASLESRFQIKVDQLNLDRYLPTKTPTAIPATPDLTVAEPLPFPLKPYEVKLPLELLRFLNFEGEVRLGHLNVQGLSISNLQVHAQAKEGLIHITPLQLKVFDGTITSKIILDLRDKIAEDSLFSLTISEMNTQLLLKQFLNKGQGYGPLNLEAQVKFQILDEKLRMSKVSLKVLDTDVQLTINEGTQMLSNPKIKGELTLVNNSLRKTLQVFKPEALQTQDASALSLLEARMAFALALDHLEISTLQVKLDETGLEARGSLDYKQLWSTTVALNIDDLDLDKYLPPPSENKEPLTTPPLPEGSTVPSTQTPLVLESFFVPLRKLQAKGVVKLGKLKVNNLKLEEVLIQMEMDKGLLNVNPASLNLYEGQVKTSLQLDVRKPSNQKSKITAKISGVKTSPLFQDLKLPSAFGTINFNSEIEVDLIQEKMNTNVLTLSALGTTVSIAPLIGTQLFSSPQFEGRLQLNSLEFKKALAVFIPDFPIFKDPAVLKSLNATLDFKVTSDSAELSQVQIKTEGSTLSSHMILNHYSNPEITFKTKLDRIDLDRYLLQKKTEQKFDAETKVSDSKEALPQTVPSSQGFDKQGLLALLQPLNIDAQVLITDLRVQKIPVKNIELQFSSQDGKINLSPFRFDLYTGTFSSEFYLDANPGQEGQGSLTLNLKQVPASALFHDLLNNNQAFGEINVNTEILFSLLKERLTIEKLQASVLNTKLSLESVVGQKLLTAPLFQGTLKMDSPLLQKDLSVVVPSLPLFQDPDVLKIFAAQLDFEITPSYLKGSKLLVKLDETTLNAKAEVNLNHVYQASFYGDIDTLNLDRYRVRPVAGTPAPASRKKELPPVNTPFKIPFELLRQLDLETSLSLKHLVVKRLTLSNLFLKAIAREGFIKLTPAKVELYEGSLATQILLDVREKPTRKSQFILNAQDIRAGALFKDLLQQDHFEGTLQLKILVDFDPFEESLESEEFQISALGATLRLSALRGRTLLSNPQLEGHLELLPFNLKDSLKPFPALLPERQDPETLSKVASTFDFLVTPDSLTVQELNLSLDQTQLKGELFIDHFEDPKIQFQLHVDALNVDRYLPVPAVKVEESVPASPEMKQNDLNTPPPVALVSAPVPQEFQKTLEEIFESLRALQLKGLLEVKNLSAQKIKVEEVLLHLNADQGILQISPLQVNLYQGNMTSEATLDLRASGSQPSTFQLSIKGVQTGTLIKDLTGNDKITLPLDFESQAQLNLREETFKVERLTLSAANLRLVSKEIQGKTLFKNPQITGSFNVEPFNLRTLLTALGQAIPETSDKKVLTSVKGDLNFKLSPQAIDIRSLHLKLDDSTLEAYGGIANVKDPLSTFHLEIDRLDLDRYLPPVEVKAVKAQDAALVEEKGTFARIGDSIKGSFGIIGKGFRFFKGLLEYLFQKRVDVEEVVTAIATEPGVDTMLLEVVRTLKMKGDLKINQLKVSNLKVSEVFTGVSLFNGDISISPLRMQLYGGNVSTFAKIDLQKSSTASNLFRIAVYNVQAGPLIEDLTGDTLLQGLINTNARIAFEGLEKLTIKKTLNGRASFDIKKLLIKDFDVAKILREHFVLFSEKIPEKNRKASDYADVRGSLKISDGRIKNNDLKVRMPLFRVTGNGYASLLSETIDYLIKAKVVTTMEGQGGEEDQSLFGITLPIRVSGTFAAPSFEIELSEYLPDLGIKKGYNAVKDTLGAGVETVGQGLKAVGSGVTTGMKVVGEGVTTGVKAVGSTLGAGAQAVGEGVKSVGTMLGNMFSNEEKTTEKTDSPKPETSKKEPIKN
ncbi:AsmA family protein [Deltaproteobacteria bacterium TL4]